MVGLGVDEQFQRAYRRTSSGGLRRDIFALDLGEDEVELMQNGIADTEGLVEVRDGFTLVATGITYGPVLALHGYKDDSNSLSLLAVATGTASDDHLRLYEWDGTSSTFSFVDSLTGYTAGTSAKIDMIRMTDLVNGSLANNRCVIISTDQDGITKKVFDGSTVDDVAWGAGDVNRALEFGGGRLFAMGDDSGSDALYFSDMQSATATGFDAVAGRHIRLGGGNASSEIQTAKVFRGRDLVVFMDDSIEIVQMTASNLALIGNSLGLNPGGTPLLDWSRTVVHNRIGCGAFRTAVNVGEDMYFCDQDMQVRSMAQTITDAQRGIKSLPISEPIKDYLESVTPSARELSHATHFGRFYILSVPISPSTEPDTIFVLDVAMSTKKGKPVWYGPWTNFDARSFGVTKFDSASLGSDNNPTLFFGQNVMASGLVMRAFDGNDDNGDPIVFDLRYRRETHGTLELEKEAQYIKVFAQAAASVTVELQGSKDSMGFQNIGFMDTLGDSEVLPLDLPFVLGGGGLVKKQFSLSDFERCTDLQFRMIATASDDLRIAGYSYYASLDNLEHEASDD